MHVGVMRLTLHVPHARSLKDKRSVVRRFRDRVRARFRSSSAFGLGWPRLAASSSAASPLRSWHGKFDVSIAEVDAQDLLQRAVFGVSVVSADHVVCERILEQVAREAETQPEAVLTHRATEIMAIGDDLYGDTDG